jgi:hypothetical protein
VRATSKFFVPRASAGVTSAAKDFATAAIKRPLLGSPPTSGDADPRQPSTTMRTTGGVQKVKTLKVADTRIARYKGFHDMNGDFVPFGTSDEVFRRASKLGARVLLRLEMGPGQELQGLFYTNDSSLTG